MNKKMSVMMGLATISIMSGFFAFDQINARETFDENVVDTVTFSVMPTEYQTVVSSGQNVPIEFIVTSANDIDLKIEISQLDENAHPLSLETLFTIK